MHDDHGRNRAQSCKDTKNFTNFAWYQNTIKDIISWQTKRNSASS